MKKITPWNKESEKAFLRCAKNGKYFTKDLNFTKEFRRRYPDLTHKKTGLLGIYRNDTKKESVITTLDDVCILPLPEPSSESLKIRRKRKFGIYRI